MNYQNKTIVITGAAKGIGAACAKVFLEAGANVGLLELDVISPTDNERSMSVVCDVSDENAVKNAMHKIKTHFGSVDCLVNNAGIQRYGSVTETSSDDWDLVMNVNLKSFFLCAKYAIPFMREAKGGSIVNISSVQALSNQTNVLAYASSKGAVNALTRAIAVDYAPEQIRCNAVLPGCVDTPMIRATAESFAGERSAEDFLHEWGLTHPIGRMATIHEIGQLVGFLCSDKSSFITGSSYVIDGGMTSQLPNKLA